MKPAVAVVIVLALAGCGCGGSSSSPSAPTGLTPSAVAAPAAGSLVLSGIVLELTTTGLRPLVGATVEITESEWGDYTNRPTTDLNGRYAFGSLMPRHYLVRASKAGYDPSVVINLGFVEKSRTQNFELVPAGSSPTVTIESIQPASGSTGGGTSMMFTGTGFQSGTTVTFGGERVNAYATSTTKLYATAPAHTAGAVDVVVTKANGASATLARGFTYAPPQSFDFNGAWVGYALAHPPLAQVRAMHSDMDMRLTVENNQVISFTCGGSNVAFSPPAISNGAFTLAPDGIAITGRIVAESEATGTIDTPACPATLWYASRQ